jgi:hypothetical protein
MTKTLRTANRALVLVLGLFLVVPAFAGTAPRGKNLDGAVLAPAAAPEGVGGDNWIDHFDTYATGSQLHGQGGWEGWANNVAFGALTSDLQARSAPNSVNIFGAADLVQLFSGYTSGVWTFTAWQYLPSTLVGTTYFIMLNTYNNDAPCTGCNWSVQVNFNGATNLLTNDGISGGAMPIVYDQWVPIRVVIDLDQDLQSFFYNGQLLYSGGWSNQVSGNGAVAIGALDLFANNATSAFYDDISLSNLPFLDGFESGDTQSWHETVD